MKRKALEMPNAIMKAQPPPGYRSLTPDEQDQFDANAQAIRLFNADMRAADAEIARAKAEQELWTLKKRGLLSNIALINQDVGKMRAALGVSKEGDMIQSPDGQIFVRIPEKPKDGTP